MNETYIIFTYIIVLSKFSYLFHNGKILRLQTYDFDTPNVTLMKNLIKYCNDYEINNCVIYTNWMNLYNSMNNFNKQLVNKKLQREVDELKVLYEEYLKLNINIEYVNILMFKDKNKQRIAYRIKDIEGVLLNDVARK